MIDWVSVGISMMFALIGFLFGRCVGKSSTKHVGTMVIDSMVDDTSHGNGVYFVFDEKPSTLKNGQFVSLDVIIADLNNSQQNQGT